MFLWRGRWMLVGRLEANRTHRHVAASLLLGLERPIRLEVRGQWRETLAALVAPEVPQALDPRGSPVLVAHLDPDTADWQRLAPRLEGADSVDLSLPEGLRERALALTKSRECPEADALLETLCACGDPSRASLDPRVARTAGRLREAPPERLDVAALAREVELSASRLTHLFRAETGVTLRRFLVHLKIQRALLHWRPGMPLATLAAEAGFHDQPHLVRTAREMFDALPSHYTAGGRYRLIQCRGQAPPDAHP